MNKGTQLLERERETERFASLLHTVREGNGSLAFISGPPGIGKTELLRSAQLLAESQGFLVLRGRGSEMEQEFAFGVVRQLFDLRLPQPPRMTGRSGFRGRRLLLERCSTRQPRYQSTGSLRRATRLCPCFTACTGCAPTSHCTDRCSSASTTFSGPISHRCAS